MDPRFISCDYSAQEFFFAFIVVAVESKSWQISYTLLRGRALFPLKASDEFQPLTHLPTREIGSLLFVPPWCTLLVERPCLHCHSSKENDAIKVKLRTRDDSSANSKHACAEGSMINLKRCYGESANNFLLTYVAYTMYWE
jgi:hypothetical protein